MELRALLAWEWHLFCLMSGVVIFVSCSLYLLPNLYLSLFAREQDLRKKYGDWAIVTGASSGIGKALTEKLALQGVNVVMVALDDKLLHASQSELQERYPTVQLRVVGADLSKESDVYMRAIGDATDDVPISMVFSNAGFLLMGFFEKRAANVHAANLECNSAAGMRIIHHFYSRMVTERRKGCVVLTSSAVCFMPAPFATMYGATKAFVTHFGTSLAIEAEKHNVDVTVIHPSYTHSNLYAKAPKVDAITFLRKFGWTPADVASNIFASAGRIIVRDLGWYAVVTNLAGRLIDHAFLSAVIIPFRDSMAPKPAGS